MEQNEVNPADSDRNMHAHPAASLVAQVSRGYLSIRSLSFHI